MARKNETKTVKQVEVSGMFSVVFDLDDIGEVQDILDHLRQYGDDEVISIKEFVNEEAG